MSNDSKEPLKGKELRDLARSEPDQAFIYLENNKDLWVQIAETDPFDSADTLEEFDPSEAGKLITSLPIQTSVKIFESLRPKSWLSIFSLTSRLKSIKSLFPTLSRFRWGMISSPSSSKTPAISIFVASSITSESMIFLESLSSLIFDTFVSMSERIVSTQVCT